MHTHKTTAHLIINNEALKRFQISLFDKIGFALQNVFKIILTGFTLSRTPDLLSGRIHENNNNYIII